MVLHHVTNGAGLLIKRPTTARHAHRFRHQKLDRRHVRPVPDRLKHRVAKPQSQNILDRLLAQIMVNPVGLRLREPLRQILVQLHGRLRVVAKRLFNHHPRPRPRRFGVIDQPRLAQILHNLRERLRRSRQIKEPIPLGAKFLVNRVQLLLQPLKTCQVVKCPLGHKQVPREFRPVP